MAQPDIVLHLFQPEDRVRWPPEWPDGFGAVAAVEKGRSILGVTAFHHSEKPGEAVARIARSLGLSTLLTPVHPPVPGLAQATLDPIEEARARDALSALLDNDLEILEAASDFAMNFEFAVSEGLSLHAHLPEMEGAAPAPPLPPSNLPEPLAVNGALARHPLGFLPMAEVSAEPRSIPDATLAPFGDDRSFLRITPGASQGTSTSLEDWSVTWSGRSVTYAIPLSVIEIRGELPAALILPFRVAAQAGEGARRHVPVDVMVAHGWLFLVAAQGQDLPKQDPVKPARAWWLRMLPGLVTQLTILVVTVGALLAIAADRMEPRDPVEALRKGLFDATPSSLADLAPPATRAP